jgi:hypothetical protein
VTDPVPVDVPVKVTEQLPPVNVQVVALNEPLVVPAVRAKVTAPVGTFEALVLSVTVAATVAVQLVAPSAIVQFTLARLVDVLSLPVTVTVTIATELVLPLWFESPP